MHRILAAFALLGASLGAAPITHDFLAIDEGLGNLICVDENDPSHNWLVPVGHPLARDLQLEGGGLVLVSHDQGYAEFEIATGKKVKDVSTYHDVSSARRLPNGNLLLAGVDFDGAKKNKGHNAVGDPNGRHVVVAIYDPTGKRLSRTTYVGDYLRLIRLTAAGTYLFSVNTVIKEADTAGHYLAPEFHADGFQHAWKAVRLPNGNTLASAGFGAFMAEFDSQQKLLRKFGGKDEVPAEVHAHFYALFQLLPNGDVVLANWQNHGPGHGKEGIQLLEFNPAGKIVWEWNNAQKLTFSSLQGVLVLDGLDPSKLHDERNGVMEPLASR
jgi:hypothetical protein